MWEWAHRPIYLSCNSRQNLAFWTGSIVIIILVFSFIFRDGLSEMVSQWSTADYSHAYIIPFVALFFVWRDRCRLAEAVNHGGAWSGLIFIIIGMSSVFLDHQGADLTVIQYGYLLSFFGLALTLLGWNGMQIIWFPLTYLILMVPLPDVIHDGLISALRLSASQLGVAVMQSFGVSVFFEGTVIDLGHYKLYVDEACSGLRYLLPLISFSCLVAYLCRGPLWHKTILVVSTVPLTLLINALRIGIIGVLVEYFGSSMAERFLHWTEGWLIFIVCLLVLYAEVGLFMRMSGLEGFPLSQSSIYVPYRSANWQEERGTAQILPLPYCASFPIVSIAAGIISLSN